MTTYADQRRACADDLYGHGGHYVLCEGNVDQFGAPIIGGGYRDIRPLTYDEALTIRLAPLQALRHAAGVEQEESSFPRAVNLNTAARLSGRGCVKVWCCSAAPPKENEMNQQEPKRPYYVKRKPIVLRMLRVIVKPLRVDENGVTYQLVADQPPKSSAAKQVIDQR